MKIAMDYVPSTEVYKRRFFYTVATLFIVIGSFLFGLVTVQSLMEDTQKTSGPPANSSSSCIN